MDDVKMKHIQAYDVLLNFDDDPCTELTTSQLYIQSNINCNRSTINVHEITVYKLLQITNIVS